jgi:tRNA-dihydrouridine synthase B
MSITREELPDIGQRSLNIGPHELKGRVVLAPMSGVTDAPFRRLVSDLGAPLAITEMTASEMLATGEARARLQAEGAGIGLHVVQLAGCEAHWLAEGARIAEGSGAQAIDINMGCPAKKVTNGYAGSALMRDLDHAQALIAATVRAVSVPVTLKMRLGWDAASLNAPALAVRAEQEGIRLVTVHGRTRCQFYTGAADWRAIRAVKSAVSTPVIANGDIRNFTEAKTALAHSGADGLMIGRAAVGQPWLVAHLADYLRTGRAPAAPSLQRQKALLIRLYEDMLEHHGVALGLRQARKHLAASADRLLAQGAQRLTDTAQRLRTEMLTSQNPKAVVGAICGLYDATGEGLAA